MNQVVRGRWSDMLDQYGPWPRVTLTRVVGGGEYAKMWSIHDTPDQP